jgi:hypothetical protein
MNYFPGFVMVSSVPLRDMDCQGGVVTVLMPVSVEVK